MSVSIQSNFSDLYLRPFERLNDAFSIAQILLDQRTWTGGFSDSSRIPNSMEDALELVDARNEGATIFTILKASTNEIIGSTGVTLWDYEHETAKIGRTIVNPDFWGKGVNHEVKLMFMDWLFESNIGRIECDVAPTNMNSMRSLEKFGFTFEGVKRRSVQRVDGTWRDTAIYSMIIDEWTQKKDAVVETLLNRYKIF